MNNDQKMQVSTPATKVLQDAGIEGKFVPPPPRGYVEILARELNTTTRTVSTALNDGVMTYKAMMIRKKYMEKYVEPYL